MSDLNSKRNFEEFNNPEQKRKSKFSYGPDQDILDDMKNGPQDKDQISQKENKEEKFQKRKKVRQILSPTRHDAFQDFDKTPDINSTTYANIMRNQKIQQEIDDLQMKVSKEKQEQFKLAQQRKVEEIQKKKDIKQESAQSIQNRQQFENVSTQASTEWEDSKSISKDAKLKVARSKWDLTPAMEDQQTPGRRYGETPTPGHRVGEMTPGGLKFNIAGATPKRRGISKWEETPTGGVGMTPQYMGLTPTPNQTSLMTPSKISTPLYITENYQAIKIEKEIDERNRLLTDEEINILLPPTGYEILNVPESYIPIRTPNMQMMQQMVGTPGSSYYNLPPEQQQYLKSFNVAGTPANQDLPALKPEDMGYFGALLSNINEEELSLEEQKERKIMMLLLKIKNGTAPIRKSALRQITINARELGAGALFNQILPLLMSPTLEDQERHLLVKVVDRILFKLDDMVRPFVHKILVVIEPLLIDEDYYARVEGREIISNLSKAAGLNSMISTMRPDIDHNDEYVRNTTARAFAVVASALGIPALLPFLKAVCKSKKSWQARHTGIKIVQQIAILMGCAILPHLKSLVEIIEPGLKDEQQNVKTITALAIAGLAEASTPYGIEAFDLILQELYQAIQQARDKKKYLAALFKAVGYIIPLMEPEHAGSFTHYIMQAGLLREFESQDQEMIKIVLKVIKQCVACEGLVPAYIKQTIFPKYMTNFWVCRMALDKRNYRQLVDTTLEIAQRIGGEIVLQCIVEDLKHENEPFRKLCIETIDKIITMLGISDIGGRLELQLMDGILHCFQEQQSDDTLEVLNGFGTVITSLGQRAKPYFHQICGIIQWRLNNKSAKIRQQAADLISRVAFCMKNCNEESRLARLSVILYENLGEEYPEVLGSILGGLKAIVNVIGMTKMTPPIKDLLPKLTPILKNRHEKVQENCIDLIGRIADRGSEYVSPKEWMRICFDLLELLKAHKKGIRRATVNTFGYIAKAIGPQDVLITLMNNLKVQERQLRVCTTVAIAIVAETCGPFTVLPSLMNEYRVPELNVQNGILKSLSFMFEYIGEMSKDYIYSIIKLLEDALIDRDLVHRQITCNSVKHLALGVQGLNCEEGLIHLLNYVWPNIFEASPHVMNAVQEAIEAIKVSIGPGYIMQYILQGLFHPARRVRYVYWKIYNMLYITSQDSLIPYYPMLEKMDDPSGSQNLYIRYELQILL